MSTKALTQYALLHISLFGKSFNTNAHLFLKWFCFLKPRFLQREEKLSLIDFFLEFFKGLNMFTLKVVVWNCCQNVVLKISEMWENFYLDVRFCEKLLQTFPKRLQKSFSLSVLVYLDRFVNLPSRILFLFWNSLRKFAETKFNLI